MKKILFRCFLGLLAVALIGPVIVACGGWQFSLLGLAGMTVAREEGLEFNLLTVKFGFHPFKPALRLPGIGIIGD